jgi:hypothetical protein
MTDGDTQTGNAQNPDNAPERPEWLPEKFKTPEEMAEAYKNSETKMHENNQEMKATREQMQELVQTMTEEREERKTVPTTPTTQPTDMQAKIAQSLVASGEFTETQANALAATQVGTLGVYDASRKQEEAKKKEDAIKRAREKKVDDNKQEIRRQEMELLAKLKTQGVSESEYADKYKPHIERFVGKLPEDGELDGTEVMDGLRIAQAVAGEKATLDDKETKILEEKREEVQTVTGGTTQPLEGGLTVEKLKGMSAAERKKALLESGVPKAQAVL